MNPDYVFALILALAIATAITCIALIWLTAEKSVTAYYKLRDLWESVKQLLKLLDRLQ